MDQELMIVVAAGGTGLVLILLVIFLARRRGKRLRLAHTLAAEETDAVWLRAEEARAGEREAAWAAQQSARRAAELTALTESLEERTATAEEQAVAAETRVDELQDALRRAESDLESFRSDSSADTDRIAELETELAGAERELGDLRVEVTALKSRGGPDGAELGTQDRLHAALLEADRLRDRVAAMETALAAGGFDLPGEARNELLPPDPWEIQRRDNMIAERDGTIARLTEELADARRDVAAGHESVRRLTEDVERLHADAEQTTEQPAPGGDLRARLVAREAEIGELEERLAAISGARDAELARLNQRLESMQMLYVDVEVRDSRISELEKELEEASSSLTSVRSKALALEEDLAAARHELEQARTGGARNGDLKAELLDLRSRLSAEQERYRRLQERKEALASPPPNHDVTAIRGIGPVIARILADNGITTLSQIAQFTGADIERIGPLLPVYPGRIEDDLWVEQARSLLGIGG